MDIIERYLNEIDLTFYEDEAIFYFYSMLFLHSAGMDITSSYISRDINKNIYNLLQKSAPQKIANILLQYVGENQPSETQQSIWGILYCLYRGLGIEKNTNSICTVAINFLYSAAKKSKRVGEYLVPRELVKIVSNILKTVDAKTIYNPFCGCGSFLMSIFEESNASISYTGNEQNQKISDIAKLLSYFYTGVQDNITTLNPLLMKSDNAGYDAVLCHIPFGAYDRRIECDLLKHMLFSAEENSTIIAIMSNGFLFREGNDAVLRECIINENYLDAVISLPQNLFYHTRIPANILVFKKNRAQTPILFIDATNDPKLINMNRKQNVLNYDGVKKISDVYVNRLEKKNFSALIDNDELIENSYKLNIDRYFNLAAANDDGTDLISLEQEINALQNTAADIEKELINYRNSFFIQYSSGITPHQTAGG